MPCPTREQDKAERTFGQDRYSVGKCEGVEQGWREKPQRTAQQVNDPRNCDPDPDNTREQARNPDQDAGQQAVDREKHEAKVIAMGMQVQRVNGHRGRVFGGKIGGTRYQQKRRLHVHQIHGDYH